MSIIQEADRDAVARAGQRETSAVAAARQPPIFVINLARRQDRLAKMAARMSAAGLSFVRIDAVDGALTDPAWLGKHFAPPGPFGPLSCAEQACVLSHFKAYRCFLSSSTAAQASHAVILEDDAGLSEEAGAMLSSLDWLPASTGLLKIERERHSVLLGRPLPSAGARGWTVAPLLAEHAGSAGYIISRSTAETLVAMTSKPALPVDYLLFHPGVSPVFSRIKPRQLVPALAEQTDMDRRDSDVEPTRTELTRLRTSPRSMAKIRREILRIVDQVRRRAAITFAGARWTRIDFVRAEAE